MASSDLYGSGLRELLNRLDTMSSEETVVSVIRKLADSGTLSEVLVRLIEENQDLILRQPSENALSRQAIIQLALELPVARELKDEARAMAYRSDQPIYVHQADSLFLNNRGVTILKEHTSEVSGLLALGDGRMVSADEGGRVLLWDSTLPVKCRDLEGHREAVGGLIKIGQDRFLTWAECMGFVRDARTGAVENAIEFNADIADAIYMDCGCIVFMSVIETSIYIDDWEHRSIVPKRIVISAFRPTQREPIWTREEEVELGSGIMHLPDGRLLVLSGWNEMQLSCGWSKSLKVIDPLTGESDAQIEELSDSSHVALLSTVEMPVFMRRFRDDAGYFVDMEGNALSLPERMHEIIFKDECSPYLLKGPGLAVNELDSTSINYIRTFTKDAPKIVRGSYKPVVHNGRYFLLGNMDYISDGTSKRAVYDIISGEILFKQNQIVKSDFQCLHKIDENSVGILSIQRFLEILDLEKKQFFGYSQVGADLFSSNLSTAIRLDEQSYAISGEYSEILLLDRNVDSVDAPSRVGFDHGVIVYGSKGKYLVTQSATNSICIYDTDAFSIYRELKGFSTQIMGLFWTPEGFLGAWSYRDGFLMWNVRENELVFKYDYEPMYFHGAMLLENGTLLCWGGDRDGPEWYTAFLDKVDMETGSTVRLLSLDRRFDLTTGNRTLVKRKTVIGECRLLSSGRLLVPPYWGSFPARESYSFDMLSLDLEQNDDVLFFPIDDHLPLCVRELPENKLLITTSPITVDEKSVSRVFLSDAGTGEMIYGSEELEEFIFDTFEIADNRIGGLTREGNVYIIDISRIPFQIEKTPFAELLASHPDLTARVRPLKDLERAPSIVNIGPAIWTFSKLWYDHWSYHWGDTSVNCVGTSIDMSGPWGTTRCCGRMPLENAFIFENSIAVLTRDERLGFIKKASVSETQTQPGD